MRGRAAAIALVAVGAPSSAMPVSAFLSKIESLDPNASAGQLLSQVSELRTELQEDAKALRGERLAAVAAGKTPAYCPPAGAAQPSADEVIAALEEVPEASRPAIEVKDALRAYLAARFPC